MGLSIVEIRRNAREAITEFQKQHRKFQQVQRHPGASLEEVLAEQQIMQQRFLSLQQMQNVVVSHDQLDWKNIAGDMGAI